MNEDILKEILNALNNIYEELKYYNQSRVNRFEREYEYKIIKKRKANKPLDNKDDS